MFLVGRVVDSKTLYEFKKHLDKFVKEVLVGKYHLWRFHVCFLKHTMHKLLGAFYSGQYLYISFPDNSGHLLLAAVGDRGRTFGLLWQSFLGKNVRPEKCQLSDFFSLVSCSCTFWGCNTFPTTFSFPLFWKLFGFLMSRQRCILTLEKKAWLLPFEISPFLGKHFAKSERYPRVLLT